MSAGQVRKARAQIALCLTQTPYLSARDLAPILGMLPATLSRHLITMSSQGQLLTGKRQEEGCTVMTYAVAPMVPS